MKYICEHCRNQVTDSQKFCDSCGSQLQSISDASDTTMSKLIEGLGVRGIDDFKESDKFKDLVKEAGKGEGDFLGYVVGSDRTDYDVLLIFFDRVKYFNYEDGSFVLYESEVIFH